MRLDLSWIITVPSLARSATRTIMSLLRAAQLRDEPVEKHLLCTLRSASAHGVR